MAYLVPSEFVTKMVDAGESKIYMSTRDALIRAYMAGAILALSAVFAVSCSVATGVPLIGALLFPVGFCMLYLLGFDLLTGVFVLTPLALIDRRPGVTLPRVPEASCSDAEFLSLLGDMTRELNEEQRKEAVRRLQRLYRFGPNAAEFVAFRSAKGRLVSD